MALVTATIRGTVTDSQTSAPIGGVNVTCDGASTLTATNGSYSFIVNLGSHTLTFRKTGYVTETRNQDCPSEGVYIANMALTPRLATITGTVTDSETANPLEDVRVTTDGFEDLTDPNGVYTLVVRLGLYTLTFTKTGYNVETTTVDCPAEGTYTVDMALTPATPPPAPEISSSTHPDENAWYSNNSPVFQWSSPSDPSGIAGYSYSIDQSSSTIPDETVDTTDNSKSYTGLADGTWYFHIRAKNNVELWSPSDHYRVNIDTNPPSTPNPDDGVSGWSSDNTPTFSWSSSSDSLSGVAGYYWKVDSGSEAWTTSLSVDLPPQSDGNHIFYVRAKDNAGNLGSYGSHDFQISTQQCLVTFYTDPAGSGFNITFQGQTYHNDTTDTLPYGTSGFVKANVPEGWVFDHWIAIGNVGVSSTSANPTTATITCGGTLKAVYALAFDFSVSASPLTRSIAAGTITTYTVNVVLKIGPTQTVTLTVLGLPTGTTAAFSPASGYPSFSSTLTITTSTSTLSGLYTLTIEGSSGGVARITTVKLTVKPKITSFTISPSPFSPNSDGSKDNTTIKASFTETVSWTLTVKNSMSQIVRTWTGTSASLQILWDGRDSNGITVPDGAYTVVLSGNSLGGIPLASTGNKKTVKVDTTPPTITDVSVNPSSFSPSLGQTTTISYTLSEACYVTIKIYNSAGTLVRTLLNNALKTAGAQSVVWNGKNSAGTKVPAGTYTIKIWVIDKAGNPATTYPIAKTVAVI